MAESGTDIEETKPAVPRKRSRRAIPDRRSRRGLQSDMLEDVDSDGVLKLVVRQRILFRTLRHLERESDAACAELQAVENAWIPDQMRFSLNRQRAILDTCYVDVSAPASRE